VLIFKFVNRNSWKLKGYLKLYKLIN
jgi:hypothetical protein